MGGRNLHLYRMCDCGTETPAPGFQRWTGELSPSFVVPHVPGAGANSDTQTSSIIVCKSVQLLWRKMWPHTVMLKTYLANHPATRQEKCLLHIPFSDSQTQLTVITTHKH